MRLNSKGWQIPLRVAAGWFILDQGLQKRQMPPEAGEGMRDMAESAFPPVKAMEGEEFLRRLRAAEIALGTALLLPVVPSGIAGAGLAAFSGALLGMYWRTPGMRQEGSPRPTMEGIGEAKNVWLLAIALALILDALSSDD